MALLGFGRNMIGTHRRRQGSGTAALHGDAEAEPEADAMQEQGSPRGTNVFFLFSEGLPVEEGPDPVFREFSEICTCLHLLEPAAVPEEWNGCRGDTPMRL